jgi:hypothetical protein
MELENITGDEITLLLKSAHFYEIYNIVMVNRNQCSSGLLEELQKADLEYDRRMTFLESVNLKLTLSGFNTVF